MWESKPDPSKRYGKLIITNGTCKLRLTTAYRYIVDQRTGWPILADKKIAMRELHLTEAQYQEFGEFVCEKLCVPDKICENFT